MQAQVAVGEGSEAAEAKKESNQREIDLNDVGSRQSSGNTGNAPHAIHTCHRVSRVSWDGIFDQGNKMKGFRHLGIIDSNNCVESSSSAVRNVALDRRFADQARNFSLLSFCCALHPDLQRLSDQQSGASSRVLSHY